MNTDALCPIYKGLTGAADIHICERFFLLQKEKILLNVQTGNDVIYTVHITQILTGGVEK